MKRGGLLVLLAAAVAALGACRSAVAGDPERGREAAIEWCGGCHVVGAGDAPEGEPPSFAAILSLRTPASIDHYLAWERHPGMPSLALEQAEIVDIVAYFERLERTGE